MINYYEKGMKKNGEAFLRTLNKKTYFRAISLTKKYLALINHFVLDCITKAMKKDFLLYTLIPLEAKKNHFATWKGTRLTSLFQNGNPCIRAKEKGNSKFFSITILKCPLSLNLCEWFLDLEFS